MLYSLDRDPPKLHPRTALLVLTALNLLNYIDRSVLFAVQPLVQTEFHLTKTQVGYLTSAFLGFYMVAAPFVGPLADRYSRKRIIVLGGDLLERAHAAHRGHPHLLRSCWFGTRWSESAKPPSSPSRLPSSPICFAEDRRGRILGVFYLAIPVGSAAGYLLGGNLGPALSAGGFRFTWRRLRDSCWRWRFCFLKNQSAANSTR